MNAGRGAAAPGTCPFCRQNAPLVYRGVLAYCTACGRARPPLTATSVNLAGQPSKVGGSVARIFGWLTLAGGVAVALILAALFQALFPAGFLGWVLGGVTAAIALAIGLPLLLGGKKLVASGTATEQATRQQAIFALAANRGGMLTALDVAQALGMNAAAADALLTDLAKKDPDQVRLEVDDAGTIYYLFPTIAPVGVRVGVGAGARVGEAPAQPTAEPLDDMAAPAEDVRNRARRSPS